MQIKSLRSNHTEAGRLTISAEAQAFKGWNSMSS